MSKTQDNWRKFFSDKHWEDTKGWVYNDGRKVPLYNYDDGRKIPIIECQRYKRPKFFKCLAKCAGYTIGSVMLLQMIFSAFPESTNSIFPEILCLGVLALWFFLVAKQVITFLVRMILWLVNK